MAIGTYSVGVNIGGLSINRTISRSADGVGVVEIVLPPAISGSLTTRTDNDTAALTMGSTEHGLSSGDIVDIYWDGGARYGVTVGTVTGASVIVGTDNSGVGEIFPVAGTAVTVAGQVFFNAAIDGNALALLGMEANYTAVGESAAARVALSAGNGTEIAAIELAANAPRAWDIAGGDSNTFSGLAIASGAASQSSVVNPATLRINWLQDATP